ncbi:MAG: winged helix-turn-helix domain-containing protein [Verrucomicrobia bacterium]|nr:winged helix-turn-helix domain-containing protein [Verrucomicrobiota bacterium]MBU4290313.1 winged helix-turn-helix domain-containing protein [Verrucomicrobiota bacterium]MBU4428027.1 winged helix-turn-helix domain-containing protein [Verrucomicrobiota bacterium]MCG2679523.1 winged helix-turn-helix domain-containing protein [Kiritimatiellia bacterium]
MSKNVNELTAGQIIGLLKLRRKIDGLDRKRSALVAQLDKIAHGERASGNIARQHRPARRKAGARKSRMREALVAVLGQAGKPLKVPAIHQALVARHFLMKSKDPKKLIGVRLYTDRKTFRKVKPGCFTLRKK